MKPHVQAWFKVGFDIEAAKAADQLIAREVKQGDWSGFEGITDEDYSALADELRGEYIVEIMRTGDCKGDDVSKYQYMRLKYDEAIGSQIRRWITNRDTFDPTRVSLGEDEVLVQVRAECCKGCSAGKACSCPTYIDM